MTLISLYHTKSYLESPESDKEIVINEIDSRLNKLKNYQDQMEIHLKHLISSSRQNYVLCQNEEADKLNDIFVQNLQDLSN